MSNPGALSLVLKRDRPRPVQRTRAEGGQRDEGTNLQVPLLQRLCHLNNTGVKTTAAISQHKPHAKLLTHIFQ